MNVILMGPPGSGKSTQAKLLAEKLGILRIATGDVSRQIANEDSDEGKAVRELISKGGLTPDDVLFRRVRKIMDSEEAKNGVLMDGYPRNSEQIFLVEEMLKEKEWDIDKVVVIDLDEEEALTRMLSRAKIEGRVDDTPEIIRERFNVYRQRTQPIVDYYTEKNKVVHVDGSGTIEEVKELINKNF